MTVSYDTMSPRGDKIEIKKKKKYSWSADNKLITWLVIFHLEVYLRSQRKLDTQMHFLLRKKKLWFCNMDIFYNKLHLRYAKKKTKKYRKNTGRWYQKKKILILVVIFLTVLTAMKFVSTMYKRLIQWQLGTAK